MKFVTSRHVMMSRRDVMTSLMFEAYVAYVVPVLFSN